MIQVIVTAMSSNLNDTAIRKTQSFASWEDAYNYYGHLINDMNLDNAEWTGASDMNLTAGGRGYDYRVELIVE